MLPVIFAAGLNYVTKKNDDNLNDNNYLYYWDKSLQQFINAGTLDSIRKSSFGKDKNIIITGKDNSRINIGNVENVKLYYNSTPEISIVDTEPKEAKIQPEPKLEPKEAKIQPELEPKLEPELKPVAKAKPVSDRIVITMENRDQIFEEINNNINNNPLEPHNNKYLRIIKIPDSICESIKTQINFNIDYSQMEREKIETIPTNNDALIAYLKENIFNDKLIVTEQNIRLIDQIDFENRIPESRPSNYHRDIFDIFIRPYTPKELGTHQCFLYLDLFNRSGPDMVYYNPITSRPVEFNIPITINEMLIINDCYFLHKTPIITELDNFRTLIYRVSCIPESEKYTNCPLQLHDFLPLFRQEELKKKKDYVNRFYPQYSHGFRFGLKYLKYKNKYLELKNSQNNIK